MSHLGRCSNGRELTGTVLTVCELTGRPVSSQEVAVSSQTGAGSDQPVSSQTDLRAHGTIHEVPRLIGLLGRNTWLWRGVCSCDEGGSPARATPAPTVVQALQYMYE